MPSLHRPILRAAAFCLALGLPALPAAALEPASPQPAPDALAPGLAVDYYFHLFRHVDELVEWQDYRDGKAGPPIPKLDYRVGQGNVLTSEGDDGVGAEITGFIRLDEPGTYVFNVRSNDGFRLSIGGERILEDPDVHADRFSDLAEVQVSEAGWYPLHLLYFERKNTSTLELYWLRPGEEGRLSIVPAEAFAHLPGG